MKPFAVSLTVAGVVCLSALLLADQQKTPVFRSEANYVEVTVRETPSELGLP